LLVGLKRGGADLSDADEVVGTSAGSVVGFTLASGDDLTQAPARIGAANEMASGPGADATISPELFESLLSSLASAAADPAAAHNVRAGVGRMALTAQTISEETWLRMFEPFAGLEWPPPFRCSAVDTADGSFRLWDHHSGVDVQHAVASSCAVPGIFPPVSIHGRRWMDGGVRDILNADAAAGHQIVVVVSCTLLEIPDWIDLPGLDAILASTRAQIDGLRDSDAKVEVVVPGPEMLEISQWGLNLMDFTRAGAAYEAGVRQGEELAGDVAALWAG
jgi:NTE family protein